MFEHKQLDGVWNCVVSAEQAYLNQQTFLELKESASGSPEASSRRQYAVIGDELVERCLPPTTIGDRWSYDNADQPWWTRVNNPPHVGIVASFNEAFGGLHRKPLDKSNMVMAYGAAGEPVMFDGENYSVTREKDGQSFTAASLPELRSLYFS